MANQKKTPSGDNREGANKYHSRKPTKPTPFPQHVLDWQAHIQAIEDYSADPSPVRRRIAEAIAARWHRSVTHEVFNA